MGIAGAKIIGQNAPMGKLFKLGLIVGLLVGINAAIEANRECRCEDDCWCKQPGLRHFRWLIPVGHKEK